jgi:chemotaxis methyl-accepting protein methylase
MHSLTPSLDAGDASTHLSNLLTDDIPRDLFRTAIQHLQNRFDCYRTTCTTPFIAPDLIVTPEIRAQSELYLPIANISGAFNRLYAAALVSPPILTSTPFHTALSWADLYVKLPRTLQLSANPAHFLKQLLACQDVLTEFLCASFLPRRFYGGPNRYPQQRTFIEEWLLLRETGTVRCLDAACGTGEQSYGLALWLSEQGFSPDQIHVSGWTLEPLEVWAAAYLSFPHDQPYESQLRRATAPLFQSGHHRSISFCCHDVLTPPSTQDEPFDLILCNGLLGGPIIHDSNKINRVVSNLADILAPGGLLLAANHFHDGWKQQCPQKALRASFEKYGLTCIEDSVGLCGLKPDEQATPG